MALRPARISTAATALALLAAALTVAPAAASRLNTATATGSSRTPPALGTVANLAIDARSGPGGVDPGGSVSFDVYINRITHLEPFPYHLEGPVTCLDVQGHRALVNFDFGFPVTVELDDNGDDGNDGFGLTTGNAADRCSTPGSGSFEFDYDLILGDGRAAVVDAPPATTIVRGPSGPIERQRARFAFTSTDPGSTFRCRLDGGPASPCSSPTTIRHLEPGRHTFRVRAVDPAGTIDPTPATSRFRIAARSRLRAGRAAGGRGA